MSGKLKFLLVTVYVVGFGFLLNFLSAGKNMGILDPKGIMASEEKQLIFIAMALMLIVVIPVYILTIHFTWKYRDNNPEKQVYRPSEDHNSLEEFIWWAIPCIIILVLGTITWTSTHRLDPYRPLVSDVKPVRIQVVALDWKWLFIYPEQGIATLGYVEIPEDTPVNFEITADAPMNSFWIPQIAGQVYAMAGMNTKLHVMAGEGVYRGVSSNFSGEGFSEMKFSVKVVSQNEWMGFAQNSRGLPQALSYEEYVKIAKPSISDGERTYGAVSPDLYNDILMKYMMPMKEQNYSPLPGMPVMEMHNDKELMIMQM
jgi:cytochrome o ubiquinol oxidase subunit 2